MGINESRLLPSAAKMKPEMWNFADTLNFQIHISILVITEKSYQTVISAISVTHPSAYCVCCSWLFNTMLHS